MTRTRNRLRFSALTAVAALAVSLLAAPAAGVPAGTTGVMAAADTGVIKGRITDEKGAPAWATITVTRVDQSWSTTTYTGFDGVVGAYLVSSIPPGDYKVSISDNVRGRQWVHQQETFDAGQVVTVIGGAELVVDEQWLPLGTVEFTVLDQETGAPVPRPCVSVHVPTNASTYTCGANGKIVVPDLVPGSWQYSLDGAATHFAQVGEPWVTVERGKTTKVTAALRRGAAAMVKVVDRATKAPLSGICLYQLSVLADGVQGRTGTYCSGADGMIGIGPFDGSPKFQLYAWQARSLNPPAKLYGDQWVTATGGSGDQRMAMMVRVPAKTTLTLPTILMDPPGSITGVVKNAAGNPVGGVCSYPWGFFPGILGLPAGRCTNAQGQYTIKDLGPYKWPVKFSAYGYGTTWSGNVANRYSATLVQVSANGTATLNATIAGEGTLTGTLRGPSGGWNGVWVFAYDAATGDLVYSVQAPENYDTGTYLVRLLNTQKVYLNFGAEGKGCWYGPASRIGRKVTVTPVAVSANAITTLNLDTRANCAASPFGSTPLPRR